MVSLEDFAKKNAPKNACQACNLSEDLLNEIAMIKKKATIAWTLVSVWLKQEHKLDVNSESIRRHFAKGHDKGEK